MDVRPFTIAVGDDQIDDLRQRLARTRWPETPDDAGWSEGTNLVALRALVEHWRAGFDWRRQEARLNALPQFVAALDGLDVHFVHVRGRGPVPMPLILTHGWPGSFIEFERIIPLLADPGAHGADPADAFDVVVPSLPGYGFSEAPTQPGYGPRRIAGLWASLMDGLGYRRYGAQGGDWGASVSTWLAFDHPDRVAGLHLNFIPGRYRPPAGPPETSEETDSLARVRAWAEAEGAYAHVQATKPRTLAYALTDSPVGLAGWLLEKFKAWSDPESAPSLDTMLTDIAIYWFTGTIGSSVRLYREGANQPLHFAPGERVTPPVAVAVFPHELPMPARSWVERVYNVTRWTPMPRGGHFAAMEQPALLAEDLRAFYRPLRG